MKISTIFSKAAEIYADPKHLASVSGCCMAIGHAEQPRRHITMYDATSEAQSFFHSVFYESLHRSRWWWAHPSCGKLEADRTARVLALLFAAEMAKEEGL